jgi:Domain of unknown function (DUF4338)
VTTTKVPPIRVTWPKALPPAARREVAECSGSLVTEQTPALSEELVERVRDRALTGQLSGSPDGVVGALFVTVLCDLALQGWQISVEETGVTLQAPSSSGLDASDDKQRVRASHLIERNRQLSQESVRRFINEMEETRLHRGRWVSVFSLMRDGEEFANALLKLGPASPGDDALKMVVDPYIQIVDNVARCKHTGLRLSDIWRYFRYTWSTAYQTVPGRRMQILVRDRAAEGHPIIGIAALGSSVVQSRVRDEWIGWSTSRMLRTLIDRPTKKDAKHLLQLLETAIADIYCKDFLKEKLLRKSDLIRPALEVSKILEREAAAARRNHERYPKQTAYKRTSANPRTVDWSAQARSFLFRSKRALALAKLLATKRDLIALGLEQPTRAGLRRVLADRRGRQAVATIIRSARARHVGIDMLDITVCGAIPPYGSILGGKLVSLLMLSPEIVRAYNERYDGSVSLIASGVKGAAVVRKPHLVLLGTTSLYGITSSQYNRLVVPRAALGANARNDLRYTLLGRTEGFGSYHFSQATLECAQIVASQGREGRRINSIFGEGVSPKLRKVREALEVAGFPSDRLLRHGSPRLVYGIALADNFREVLFGRTRRPRYILRAHPAEVGTELLSRFWRQRWLDARIRRDDVLSSVASHSLVRPVRHGARVFTPGEAELPLFATVD